ncbi:MAG: hypothetical protein IJT73_07530 [Selenomonadaceae bacterium]|nr:hypothetical protein [Selenomonadaceae bacterium]
MKKFLSLLLLTFVCLSSVAMARPVKIARLPIIIQHNKLDAETSAALETKFARVVNIPLNQTLKVAEYIPPNDSAQALQNIWQKMYVKDKKSKMTDAVKTLARDIRADIVICPILRRYSQIVSPSNLSFESRLASSVSAELIVYDKRTGNLIDKKSSRSFNNTYNRLGTASYLAGECFDTLIKETKLRQTIHNIKN